VADEVGGENHRAGEDGDDGDLGAVGRAVVVGDHFRQLVDAFGDLGVGDEDTLDVALHN
jgi:hypothetical protein